MSLKLLITSPTDRVLAEQRRLKLNDKQLAAKFGITKQVWFSWKTRGIPKNKYGRVAEILKWSTDFLIYGKEPTREVSAPPLDAAILRDLIRHVEEWLKENRLTAPPEKKADVIVALYEYAIEHNDFSNKSNVERMLKLVVNQ